MFSQPSQFGYDKATVIFSPDGRIIQVEYAREAVKMGSTAVGIKTEQYVVLAGQKRTFELIESADKVFKIDDHIASTFSGYSADGRALLQRARIEAQIERITYGEKIDPEVLSEKIGDYLQSFTQYGGVRPFGIAVLFGSVYERETSLYFIDPGGAIFSCLATAIGSNEAAAKETLKKGYKRNLTKKAAIKLALDALKAAIEEDETVLIAEMAVIETKDGLVQVLSQKDIDEILKT
ncbi:MAG: archaeal proteasome endopeptidase complex subunit alpha [Candidatus Heimdallarchaeota archaeon]|nr:archaeal proteasome endopeptidase complex subunit alpha [Candidatus Heimdallarchaeota archaeon]MCK4289854.1 archaeal proteasome endopeptidase complex subunit alpha [Candidatus Heimdallarchaeota archaeon]